ncbi:polyketide syntase 2 [Rhizodiscina lignyota]|uniref:6-methylsalicylic acid synthase n=1 Tax=Rhizodiscina lignyota TaxID=1504668 RepID=A0A9P4M5H6_9PEZI|nr:polyketide syntase 2 [Rhizodiscina lignyota]
MSPFLDVDAESSDSFSVVSGQNVHASPEQSRQLYLDDIAVVGMACRAAGENDSPEKLWDSILGKVVASKEMDPARWEPYNRRDSRNPKILKETTSRGYFVDNIGDFDSTFFGISPKEAVLMDPQQRITTEITWEALEDAGIPPQSLAGSNTAVYMGVNSDDYSKLLLEDLPGVEAWMGIGTAYCGVPNRISYLLDLRGPSTAVDAACASSLVAVHHGRQSLLARETDIAIVGGVNAICGPGLVRVLDKAGAISKDGMCRSFDDGANGYGRGEGAAVIILKRMTDALHNKDRILAVLKGSAVGQDGRTNGIMAPNGLAQEAVARQALGNISPATIEYVEAHATSTSVGDPVEIGAMSKVYGANRPLDLPCYIGSVKPNIGHLEAGAGAMGFIKAVLAIRNGIIPPQANLKTPNKKIDWASAGLKVPTNPVSWLQHDGQRRAAVCSYGYGGTVSHAVIESAPPVIGLSNDDDGKEPTILVLAAPQEKRLAASARALGSWTEREGRDTPLKSIASTLATRRGHHDYRIAFIVDERSEIGDLVTKLSSDTAVPEIVSGRSITQKEHVDACWMFSGHGAQWPDMGKELLVHEPVFRSTVEELDPIIYAEVGFSPFSALAEGKMSSSDEVQILTYVVQVALASLLHSKGAQPGAIIGHSVGEIAASVVAGALTPEEGAIVVSRRAKLYREVMGYGAMALVHIPFHEASDLLTNRSDLFAAIDSSPSSCVVSGTVDAVKQFSAECQGRGIKALQVKSDIAFHCPLLNSLTVSLSAALTGAIEPQQPTVALYSTAFADARVDAPRDAAYWVRNMLQPVLLRNAVCTAAEDGHKVFMEISSHPIIKHSVEETLMDMDCEDALVIPTLLRSKPTRKSILKCLGALWCKGISIDWQKLFAGVKWTPNVPKTQWMHQTYWKEISTGATEGSKVHDVDSHTLLGQCIPIAGAHATLFTTKIDENTKPFPGNHPLHGTEIIPAAVLFNTFLHATGENSLSNINLRVPVAISAPRDVQILAQDSEICLMSRLIQANDDETDRSSSWLTHTTASIKQGAANEGCVSDIDIEEIRGRIGTELKSTFSIDYLDSVGVSAMGFPWAVTQHMGNTKEMLAQVDTCPSLPDDALLPWHSASWAPIFDSATSVGSTLFYETPRLRMPAHVEHVTVREGAVPPKTAYIYVQEACADEKNLAVHVTITDETGQTLARLHNMKFAEIEGTPGARESADGLVHQLAWPPAKLREVPLPMKHVFLIGDCTSPLLSSYQRQLEKRGIKTSLAPCISGVSSGDLAQTSEGRLIVYLPAEVKDIDAVSEAANQSCKDLLDIVKAVAACGGKYRIYVATNDALSGAIPTGLAHAPLVGLSRIIAAEHPQLWGALIDLDSDLFPFQAVKHVSDVDVIKMADGIARIGRLRPMPREKLLPASAASRFEPKARGTYVVSGGLGALGLEVAAFLVERGARRIVLLSRRALPPRKQWEQAEGSLGEVMRKIEAIESTGASIHTLDVDLSSPEAATMLMARLEAMGLPKVLGVIHAAGVLEDQMVLNTTRESFNRVLAPKIAGALALHKAFPPGSVDFFMLFSSCGQLFGFPGQASYASGNAFLDSLAEHRRAFEDNSVAFQWTSWRGMGMAASTDFIEAELATKGITSVSRNEAFLAWDEVAKYDISHGVVLRALPLNADEPLPADILEEIAVRCQPTAKDVSSSEAANTSNVMPPPGQDRFAYLEKKITECVATVLQMNTADVDAKVALPELGMDSVMTVTLRRQLQQVLKVKIPPTLIWGHPTVSHLTKWFVEQLSG